jgi:hypothetical protein
MHREEKITYGILFLVVSLFLIINYLIVTPLVSLPSPIYGGDYYFQLGQTNHVKYGGNPLDSANINDAKPIYFILYSFFTGNIARLFNINGITAEFIFSYMIIALSIVTTFFFVKYILNNTFVAVLSTLLFVNPGIMPIIKYTDFAVYLMMPLFLLMVFHFVKEKKYLNSILLGIVYGLIGLTHSVAFISASLLIAAVFIYYFVIKNFDFTHKKYIKENIKREIIFYLIIFVIGVSIALLWWYQPIFIYHGQTSPHYTEWNNQDWSNLNYQFGFLYQTIKQIFFSFDSIKSVIYSLFNVFGLIGILFIKRYIPKIKFIRFLFISSLIITFHYLLTQNAFGINLIPGYINFLLLVPSTVILFSFGIIVFYQLIIKKVSTNNTIKTTFYGLIIIVLLISQVQAYNQKINDKWYQAGKNPLPPQLLDLKYYLIKNSDVYDTILTTKEIGFAVTALSGRKLLVARRAHNDPFLDLDPREMAAAIILYGNNTKLKKELIQKYDIKYLYWDYYWIQSEYYFDNAGQITGWFDPLILFYSKEYEQILKANGIKYFIETTWVDPALKGESYKKFKLIFISPQNYHNFTHPWDPDLDKYLIEVWSYEQKGQKIARLFEII